MLYLFITLVAAVLQVIFIILKIIGTEPISDWSWFVIFIPLYVLILAFTNLGKWIIFYFFNNKLWYIVAAIVGICYLAYLASLI